MFCLNVHHDITLAARVRMFGLQDSVSALPQVRGPVTALKEEPLATSHGLAARTWMQPGIVDPTG